jgi:hypothetical protein
MDKFRQYINVAYPPGNKPIFEEWFTENYSGCSTDRQLIPAWFTSYWVNNNYGNDLRAKQAMQQFIDSLDRNKRWFTVIQYDDGALIDFKDLDVLQFNMSKSFHVSLPLLCRPHPYYFSGSKKWLANFIGSNTHPVRNSVKQFDYKEGYYISFERHKTEDYCRVLHESVFTLCPRGYGANSFRISEAVQYGSIPVYISDEFTIPAWMDFESFGVLVDAEDAHRVNEIIESIEPAEVVRKQERLAEAYQKFYTFESTLKHIVSYIETEYNKRQTA